MIPKGVQSETVSPAAYIADNYGPNVQAVTFSYKGETLTINRRGKSNVRGYFSDVKGTYTFTNGKDRFLRLDASKVNILFYTETWMV